MKKEEVRAAYKAAIDDGYTHAAVARATEIGVSSLKKFYNEDSGFSDDSAAILEAWLRPRGFMDREIAKRDPFEGIIVALRNLAEDLEAETRFPVRVQRLLGFVNLISRDPVVVGFQDTNKAGQE